MAFLEDHALWTFTGTTGGGTAHDAMGYAERLSVYYHTDSACTVAISMQSAPSTAGPWGTLIDSTSVNTGATTIKQAAGPVMWVRPYVTAITASQTVTVEWFGN